MVTRHLLTILSFLLMALTAQAQMSGNGQVSSRMSHQSIGLDETATLTITVSGVSDVTDMPIPQSRPRGLEIVPVGRSFSMTSMNGVTQTSTDFNFLITPMEKGRFVIEPVTVNINGVNHTTDSFRLEVTDAMGYSNRRPSYQPGSNNNLYGPGGLFNPIPQAAPPVPQGEDLILEAELEPEEVYVHEATVYNLRLLAAVRLLSDPRYRPINPTGLVSVQFPQENSMEYRGDRNYAVTEARTAFFPLTEGEFTFPASEIDFSSGLFGRSQRLSTLPKVLKVKPLPTEGRPDSFTGAVGEDFEIRASLGSPEIQAGQTVELNIEVKGDGNLDLVPYPFVPNISGMEKKQLDGASSTEVVDGRIVSQRTYKFRLKFKQPGDYELKGIALAYFRPSIEQYDVLKTMPLKLKVAEGVSAETSLADSAPEELPESDRPALLPGSGQKKAVHLTKKSLLAIVSLALLGLALNASNFNWKATRWTFAGENTRRRPKTLAELEQAISRLAPGHDTQTRRHNLSSLGWGTDAISQLESIKAQVSALRYGARECTERPADDLIESFVSLQKQVKIP